MGYERVLNVKFFYSPTSAQMSALKTVLKFTLK